MHTTWANDPVNSPNHYTRSHPGMECIELTADTSFCLGNAISDSTQPFTRTNPETIQAYEEGKQLMEARYGRFDAMKEARHINPYRDGDR